MANAPGEGLPSGLPEWAWHTQQDLERLAGDQRRMNDRLAGVENELHEVDLRTTLATIKTHLQWSNWLVAATLVVAALSIVLCIVVVIAALT